MAWDKSMRLAILFLLSGCGHGGGGGDPAATKSVIDKSVLSNLSTNVALPTYQAIVAKTTALNQAAETLKGAPTDANLATAQQAWRDARIPWEQSEGLKFGPAFTGSLDFEHILDYPVISETEIQQIVAGQAAITGDSIKQYTDASGFHAVEFLLFGSDGKKTAAALQPRELDYLVAAAGNMADAAKTLLAGWQTSYNGGPAFSLTFSTAGDPSNTRYPSFASAGADLVEAMGVNSNELQVSKIGYPFKDQNADEVESRYSNNSLTDFTDNVKGMEAIYRGAAAGRQALPGGALKEHVAAAHPEVDKQIEADFAACDAALAAIPAPFSKSVVDPAAAGAITQAISALATLTSDFASQLQPLTVGQ